MSEELTVESATAELEQIGLWLQNLAQLQQQHSQITIRAGFLQGFLAAQPGAGDDGEPDAPKPAPARTKRTTPKG